MEKSTRQKVKWLEEGNSQGGSQVKKYLVYKWLHLEQSLAHMQAFQKYLLSQETITKVMG